MTNQILKFLYSQINKSIGQNSERDFQNFERADKIIIWIVGFSIGIFVLLITSEVKSTNPIFIPELISSIAITSLFVIIQGLIFRIFSFFTQMVYSDIIVNFSSFADSFASAPEFPSPREINDSDTSNDILYFLKEDFGVILNKPPDNLSQERILEYRRLHYNYYSALADSNNVEKQFEEYRRQIANHFGVSKKSIEKNISNENKTIFKGKLYRALLICSYILFSSTIGTFIFGAIIILNKLLHVSCH